MSVQPESIGQRQNLDRFLEHLFREKIEFNVDDNFIRCLQTTVENCIKHLFNDLMELQEVQTAVQKLQDECKDNYNVFAHNDVLYVGSFYEGTKNNFPDEFDYLLILFTAERYIYTEHYDHKIIRHEPSMGYHKLLSNFVEDFAYHIKNLPDIIKIDSNQLFDLEFTSLERSGPACKLCFTLKKKIPSIFEGDSKKIHVDITPAIKIIDSNLPTSVETICFVDGFRDEIVKTGSFIVIQKVGTYFTFTETEVLFMKTCLSTRHKRTYRLLKYLINGEMEENKLRCMRGLYDCFEISSYVLKTLMINHHYSCKNHDILTESRCVIDVLKKLQSYVAIDAGSVIIPLLQPNTRKMICGGKAIVRHFNKELLNLISTLMSESSENVLDEDAVMTLSNQMYTFISTQERERERRKAQC